MRGSTEEQKEAVRLLTQQVDWVMGQDGLLKGSMPHESCERVPPWKHREAREAGGKGLRQLENRVQGYDITILYR